MCNNIILGARGYECVILFWGLQLVCNNIVLGATTSM